MNKLDEFFEAIMRATAKDMAEALGIDGIATAGDPDADKCMCVVTSRKGPTPFTDNLHGDCALCGEEVMFRPHSPKLPKVCTVCFFSLGGEEVERRLTVN